MSSDEPRSVDVIVLETRVGKLAVVRDPEGGEGVRPPTDLEKRSLETLKQILDSIDPDAFDDGEKIAEIHVPEDGEPTVEWTDAAAAELCDSGGEQP